MLRQELLYFKTENLKFKENLDQFLKLHEAKKQKEQMTRIENLNQRIDRIIAKDEKDNYQQFTSAPPQKRTRNEIWSQEETSI